MFFKVIEEAGVQNPERRRIVHLRVGHVDIDRRFADWEVKGMGFPNLPNSRNAKPQSKLHFRVSEIGRWRSQRLSTLGVSKCRNAKSQNRHVSKPR
jgi:hypothetical protein